MMARFSAATWLDSRGSFGDWGHASARWTWTRIVGRTRMESMMEGRAATVVAFPTHRRRPDLQQWPLRCSECQQPPANEPDRVPSPGLTLGIHAPQAVLLRRLGISASQSVAVSWGVSRPNPAHFRSERGQKKSQEKANLKVILGGGRQHQHPLIEIPSPLRPGRTMRLLS